MSASSEGRSHTNSDTLLRDNPIRPLNQRYKYRRVTKLRPIVIQIRLSHSSGTGARPTSVDRNMLRGELVQRHPHRRPSDWRNGVGKRLSHQSNCLPQQEKLHLVSSFRERQPMQKGKRCFGGIVGTPRALHHDLQRLVRSLSPKRTTTQSERQSCQLSKS